jgi:hypothetical protein
LKPRRALKRPDFSRKRKEESEANHSSEFSTNGGDVRLYLVSGQSYQAGVVYFLINRKSNGKDSHMVLNFVTHNSDKIASDAETMLRKDLGVKTSLPWQVLSGEGRGIPQQGLLATLPAETWTLPFAQRKPGLVGLLQGDAVAPLCYLHFKVNQPRSFELQILIAGAALGGAFHRLVYAVPLSKSVSGPINLSQIETRAPRFAGHPATVNRLNANPDLAKQAQKAVVTSVSNGRITLSITECLIIYPQPVGSLLLLHTLPDELMMRGSLRAGEVLKLGTLLEDSLY